MSHASERKVVEAVTVHHIKPVETHPELGLDPSNFESVCLDHHKQAHGARPKCEVDPATGLPRKGSGYWWDT